MAQRIVVVGAGPVGLVTALELARHGVPALVLEARPEWQPEGSKAMVFAGHAFDILERVGCPECLAQAVVLRRARTFYRGHELFAVDFPPPGPGETPRFANLQQTYVEGALLRRAAAEPLVELRRGARVGGLEQDVDGVTLTLAGGERVRAAWVVGADGPGSAVRKLAGVEFPGKSFEDRFLIADIRARLPFPHERRFHFDPPWNPGRQVLIHPQPDEEWRIDWQVPQTTDVDEERRSRRMDARIRQIVGDTPYELAWLTSYRFHQRLAERFRAGRVLLAGDAAHLMSAFGARGLNSGLEDAVAVAWRLALVARGEAADALLDEFARERRAAALVNLAVTGRTMRFMAPPTPLHRLARNVVLRGSVRSRALRRRVDSGKLAVPAEYGGEPPVGRLVPARAPVEPAASGFAVAAIDGRRYLVRPDGYVAAALGAGSGDVRDAVRRQLGVR
jgi:2-polyprenyl-6-methoxyphenol hydroxylase-like FAD-dependent oxidoreductase